MNRLNKHLILYMVPSSNVSVKSKKNKNKMTSQKQMDFNLILDDK